MTLNTKSNYTQIQQSVSRRNEGRNIFVGGAWPYANGPLHIGHVAALLPGDVVSRYYRLTGANVLFVSGSDCHGTPISVKAASEQVDPIVIAERYHKEFQETLGRLGFTYDLYSATCREFHRKAVQQMFLELSEKQLVYAKRVQFPYCATCNRFLPDRYMIGTCPKCGFTRAQGDQCDACGSLIDFVELVDKKCVLCGSEPRLEETEHLYFRLSSFQEALESLVNSNEHSWRQNAVAFSRRYLKEGLPDRAVTRDLDWGIDVPIDGFSDKKIYVWFEAVLGYLTASMEWAAHKGHPESWRAFWNDEAVSYYAHGKDNIPFHTLILPALLMALGVQALPKHVISSEYLTLEGKKLSTSRNWAVWADDFLARYEPDALRFFLIANGPEKRDSDFTWRDFVERNNSELLGDFGNLVNRTMVLMIKGFGKQVPTPDCYSQEDKQIVERCKSLYESTGDLIEMGELREGLKQIFETARAANKYFDSQAPWSAINHDKKRAATVLKVCLDIAMNLANMSAPFIPEIAKRALSFVNRSPSWDYFELTPGEPIADPSILVKRLDRTIISEETARLGISQ